MEVHDLATGHGVAPGWRCKKLSTSSVAFRLQGIGLRDVKGLNK